MAESWKKKIDARMAEKERQRQYKVMLDETIRKTQEQKEKQRLHREFIEWSKRFRCCVCGKTATTPDIKYVPDYPSEYYSNTHPVDDWSKPGDLKNCEICKQWVCSDHIYEGICQKCAEKL